MVEQTPTLFRHVGNLCNSSLVFCAADQTKWRYLWQTENARLEDIKYTADVLQLYFSHIIVVKSESLLTFNLRAYLSNSRQCLYYIILPFLPLSHSLTGASFLSVSSLVSSSGSCFFTASLCDGPIKSSSSLSALLLQ